MRMEVQTKTQVGKQVQPRIGTDYIPKTSSRDSGKAPVYRPFGGDKKPISSPEFEEENFFPGKKLPKPDIKKYDPGFGGRQVPVYVGPIRGGYGKDSQDLEELIERYISELQKYLKGKNIRAGIVFMPYSRN
jgi:hypothetical protein